MRQHIEKIVSGKRYSTRTALCIASDEYCDGANWDRCGRNTHLYRTKNGAYFEVHSTMWQGERTTLEVLSLSQAKARYAELPEEDAPYSEAFPDEQVVEA